MEEQRRLVASDKPLSNLVGPRGVQILLLNCGVMSEGQLPPIWAELANATKRSNLQFCSLPLMIRRETALSLSSSS